MANLLVCSVVLSIVASLTGESESVSEIIPLAEAVILPTAWELATHAVSSDENDNRLIERGSLNHPHHLLAASVSRSKITPAPEKDLLWTSYVNLWKGNFHGITRSSSQPLIAFRMDPMTMEFWESSAYKSRKDLRTLAESSDASVVKSEVFSQHRWADDKSDSFLTVDLNSLPTERTAVTSSSYKVSRNPVDSATVTTTGQIDFNRSVVPLTMAYIAKSGTTGPSLILIDKLVLGTQKNVTIAFIEQSAITSDLAVADNLTLSRSPRGVTFLNQIYASVLIADNSLKGSLAIHQVKDYCFSFRPTLGFHLHNGAYFFEGTTVAHLEFSENRLRLPMDMKRILWDNSNEKLFVDASLHGAQAVAEVNANGQMLFVFRESTVTINPFITGKKRVNLRVLFPGLPDDVKRVDHAWWNAGLGRLFLFVGDLFWKFQFIDSTGKWQLDGDSGGSSTFHELTPFVPLRDWDSIISLPIVSKTTNEVIRRTYFFMNGYYFSITDQDATHYESPTSLNASQIHFALDQDPEKALISGLDICGTRYAFGNVFSVADHVTEMETFHRQWHPTLAPPAPPPPPKTDTSSTLSTTSLVLIIAGAVYAVLMICGIFYYFREPIANWRDANFGTYRTLFGTYDTNDTRTARSTMSTHSVTR